MAHGQTPIVRPDPTTTPHLPCRPGNSFEPLSRSHRALHSRLEGLQAINGELRSNPADSTSEESG